MQRTAGIQADGLQLLPGQGLFTGFEQLGCQLFFMLLELAGEEGYLG